MDATKSSRWSFTAFESDYDCFKVMPEIVAEWGWQEEVAPTTGKHHYQGYMRLKRQARLAQLKKIFPTTHFEIAKNWDALVNYCKKTDTAVEGTQHHATGTKYLSMSDALIKVAANRPNTDSFKCESDEDYKRRAVYEYDAAVGLLLRADPNLIGLYSQPQYERAYVKWRAVWIEHSEKTDRQTDTEGGLSTECNSPIGEVEHSDTASPA